VIEQSPRYGVVGREVTAKFHVEDPNGGTAPVTITVGGEIVKRMDVPVGKPVEVPITVANPGPNVVELEVAPGQNELTLDNNRASSPSPACATGCACCWCRASPTRASGRGETC